MNATALEQDSIHHAINLYIDGLREGSVETLKQAFHFCRCRNIVS